jgi:hypothetical protein
MSRKINTFRKPPKSPNAGGLARTNFVNSHLIEITAVTVSIWDGKLLIKSGLQPPYVYQADSESAVARFIPGFFWNKTINHNAP